MSELAELQVDQHVAAQQTVVEDEVDEEMLFVEGEPLLPSFKEEALPKLKQEVTRYA